MLSVMMLSVTVFIAMLCVVILNVVILSVIMLSVTAPEIKITITNSLVNWTKMIKFKQFVKKILVKFAKYRGLIHNLGICL